MIFLVSSRDEKSWLSTEPPLNHYHLHPPQAEGTERPHYNHYPPNPSAGTLNAILMPT